MKKPFRTLGVIPARGGSKEIPGKNIRLVAGEPLIVYSIKAARQSRALTDFLTTTDDKKITKVARTSRYDYILSYYCVEHVPGARRLLKAFFKALKPGGILAVEVTNAASETIRRYGGMPTTLLCPFMPTFLHQVL